MFAPSKFGSRQLLSLFVGAGLSLVAVAGSLRAEALLYLPAGQPDSAVLLAPPPLPHSAEQAADLAAVVAACRGCTTNDAALAFGEKKFSIFNFAPAIGGFFQPGRLPRTEAFFHHLQKDAAAAADAAKDYWKRPRPFMVDPSLASGSLEKSFGYPSGHATEGMVLALVLAELFPDRREAILAIGRDLGWHRVGIGRHYPTDIYAGRVFALAIVRQMKTNPAFQHDLAEAKAEIVSTARTAETPLQPPIPGSAAH
ncbi:MAG: phosphatase PAP2 family protein [Limisphaerales bacterium]